MFVRRVESENHVGAELLQATLALGAGAIRIDHAANRSQVTGLVLRNGGPDLGDTTNDFVTGDDRVIRGHELAPLVADRVQIGVADATEQNFDLHVAVSWIAAVDLGGRQA